MWRPPRWRLTRDRFDTAYDAFRDLANDLYGIDLKRYSRGVTSEDAAGVPLKEWAGEATRAGAPAPNLASSAPDYPS